jgi:cytochrome c biogenesis protein CcmG, thiol:disulfide interchange protein DsbE
MAHRKPMFARAMRGVATFAMVLVAAGTGAHAAESGGIAPDFELPGSQGPVTLSAYRGKTIYLDFWASWCGPCRRSFPWMNELQEKYGKQGLQVIAINVDQRREDAHRFLERVPARFIVAYDPSGATPRRYGVKGMPSSALITPDGKLVFLHAGFDDDEKAGLESQIKQVLEGKTK